MYIEKPDEFSNREFGLSMSTESRVARLDLSSEDCNFYVYMMTTEQTKRNIL